MSQPSLRYHALDFLRGFAMFLGILLHGVMSFTEPPVPFWPVHDPERSPVATLFLMAVHDFRMQAFFVLAGFFGCLLYRRSGRVGMLRHRFWRIVVPFALGLALIQPALQALWLIGDPSAVAASGMAARDCSVAPGEALRNHFTSGAFLRYIAPVHMWFLYFLIYFYLVMTLLALAGDRLSRTRVGRMWDAGFRKLVTLPGRSFLLAALTVPLLWPMAYLLVDTEGGWRPGWHLMAYYFVFFLFGWTLFRHLTVLSEYCRRWRLTLLLANVVVLPVMLLFNGFGIQQLMTKPNDLPSDFLQVKLVALCSGALYTWMMIPALMGAFQHWFGGERPWVRYLADASYWCYLMSVAPLVVLQMVFAPTPLPGIVKYFLINFLTLALLLATYEWCVRYTIVGAILNGRRHRKAGAVIDSVGRESSTSVATARVPEARG